MIRFDNVTLQYPYEEYALFKGVSFTLCDGLNTVLCDVQSGKTSLCRLLVKDVAPTSGQITVDGKSLDGITNANLDILYLSDKPSFFDRRSILYNIEYPLKVRRVGKEERRKIASEAANRLGVTELKRKMRTLSAEERKRCSLVRGSTVLRKYVLWDDFFDGEDADDMMQTLALFGNACNIIVTSDARQAVGNTVVLDGGVTAYQGDALSAQQQASRLGWLFDALRSK